MKRIFLAMACLAALFAGLVSNSDDIVIDRVKYLALAEQLAQTVEETARDPKTGLYASHVNTSTGERGNLVANNAANWYMNGLWMLFWETGDRKYLDWIEAQSEALWTVSADPATGLPYLNFDLAGSKPAGGLMSHRIQYQVCAYKHWDQYVRSLRSAMRYQIVEDAAGNRMALHDIGINNPENPAGRHSPDFFGCLDLRIPYALGVIEKRPELYQAIVDDFYSHTISMVPGTGLWTGTMLAPAGKNLFAPLYPRSETRPGQTWKPGMFVPDHVWTGTIADNTYTGLILHDLTGQKELFDMVKDQTRLALKYCFHPEKHYFPHGVSTITGKALAPTPRWHTNWEWALTLYILHAYTGDPEWEDAGEKNYRFVVDNHADPGHYSAAAESGDWNAPQIVLLSIFRYHQTGEERYLKDAVMVADYLIEHRLHERGGRVFLGDDQYMELREVGDMIAMLACLSDPGLPVVSARYFLFPVGIRSPSFPVFEDAAVTGYRTRDDGVLEASLAGGSGQEDIWVMHLSGAVDEVSVNGAAVEYEERQVAGHRYLVIPSVKLGKVKIEVRPR